MGRSRATSLWTPSAQVRFLYPGIIIPSILSRPDSTPSLGSLRLALLDSARLCLARDGRSAPERFRLLRPTFLRCRTLSASGRGAARAPQGREDDARGEEHEGQQQGAKAVRRGFSKVSWMGGLHVLEEHLRLGFGGLEQEDGLGRSEVGLWEVDVRVQDRQAGEQVGDRLAEERVRVDQCAAGEQVGKFRD